MNLKYTAVFACALSLSLLEGIPALSQGDPVPPVAPPVQTPVQAPQIEAPTQPNFLQVIQQQQQLQNIFQNIQIPTYTQTNPAISPLDQRSGLATQSTTVAPSVKTLTITTTKTPTIINSNLLAPSDSVTTVKTTSVGQPIAITTTSTTVSDVKPTTTTSLINSKPSFDSLTPLFENLAKLSATTTTAKPVPTNVQTLPTTTSTTSASDLARSFKVSTSTVELQKNRINTVMISLQLEPEKLLLNELKTDLNNATTKLNSMPKLTDIEQKIKDVEKKLLWGVGLTKAQKEANLRLEAELDDLKKSKDEHIKLTAKVKDLNARIKESEAKVTDLSLQRMALNRAATPLQEAAKKASVTSAPPTLTASSPMEAAAAKNVVDLLTGFLNAIDNASTEIKYLRSTLVSGKVDSMTQAVLDGAQREVTRNVAMVKQVWSMVGGERQALAANQLQQKGDYEYLLQVVNSAIK